ncbi:MAG TPA: hypothetical protein VG245_04525 [Candidatus Dormibacteraeota bacterium]|jgi:hypothetical protein|nr:hypothetical protein [Candidatus Dormibacteraeota bacterium]
MSKHTNDRLSLNRETVRELTPAEVESAAGGMNSSELCYLIFGQLTTGVITTKLPPTKFCLT